MPFHDFEAVFDRRPAVIPVAAVIRGPKRMLVWPYEALLEHVSDPDTDLRYEGWDLDELDPAGLRGQATVLDGDSGDLLYWPASYWHVAEADERQLSLTLNLSVASTQPLEELLRWRALDVVAD